MESSNSYVSLSSSSSIPPAKPPTGFRSSLHSVRKLSGKPMKQPIAPLPPTPPKVYKVDPINFKEVVQKLTGAPEFQPRHLHEVVVPPPLNLSASASSDDRDNIGAPLELFPSPSKSPLQATFPELTTEAQDEESWKLSESFGAPTLSPVGFSPPPYSLAWWPSSSLLMSPGTLSSTSLERGRVYLGLS
ncbi:unnamed protein product [Ilex paraguariensis]|uniref:VQ domain-containing protein n=1 Tax=Ilex paraguariensis TaxID=185542 RepID=A0ABC8UTM1_9AQUA